VWRKTWTVATRGQGFTELTAQVRALAREADVTDGLCHVFLAHTSASLILSENADPDVRRDLAKFFSHLAPEGDSLYVHRTEGPDDMPAHIRTVLTQNSITLPVLGGQLALGHWQGLYLWEHRRAPHERRVIATIW
jgi:secondary thiamine-phosphate synthase enzyme